MCLVLNYNKYSEIIRCIVFYDLNDLFTKLSTEKAVVIEKLS
jgi:hypothetical protein